MRLANHSAGSEKRGRISKEDKYLQFPLCLLALPDDGLLEAIIRYGMVEAGRAALLEMEPSERKPFGIAAAKSESWEFAARLGADICGITIGSMEQVLRSHQKTIGQITEWTKRYGREPLVRIKKSLCFETRDGQGLSVREFRVLVGIYSSIGRNPYRAVTESVIRVRAIGCKCVSVMNAANNSLPAMLSEKEARGTITRLHELGFYARVTPIRHGRKTFYSIRLTDSELRERLVKRAVYSQKFAAERRRKDQELEGRIRKQKGDYNSAKNGDYNSKAPEEHRSNATEGRREGDARETERRREGDYDRNTLNRKPIDRKPLERKPVDRKPMNDSPLTPSGGEHHSQANDAGVVDSESPPVPIEDGYSFEGQFFTSEQASRFLADNADRAQEIIRKMKPAIRQGNHVQLGNP